MDLIEDRIWLFKSLVGSHNYNLNTEDSDRDYKIFFLPNFDDLYSNNNHYNKYLSKEEDIEAHDIRKVVSLWYKANINYLEVLFTKQMQLNGSINYKIYELLLDLIDMKHDIANMNLPYLFDACIGMHFQKKGKLEKGTEGTMHLVEKYGYDTKQALHAYRVLDFLIRYFKNGFSQFHKSIRYENKDILDIKYGKYNLTEIKSLLDDKFEEVSEIEDYYKQSSTDKELKNKIDETVKEMVKMHIRGEGNENYK